MFSLAAKDAPVAGNPSPLAYMNVSTDAQ